MLKRILSHHVWAALALALALCACGPVPGSRPTATYGFVRSPTPDLTQNPATLPPSATPAPTETPQPEPAPTDEPTPRPSPEPSSVPAITVTAALDLELPSVAAVDCEAEGDIARCTDPVLGLTFEQPESWGPITATLRESVAGTGLAYDYQYAETPSLMAGGRSAGFTEGRGGMPTDFAGSGPLGFNGATPEEWCAELTASGCEIVQPNVVLAWRMPEAAGLCDQPDFELQFKQKAFVWVLLPASASINGFVFVAPFLSAEADEHLLDLRRDLLGWDGVSHAVCSLESQAAFDAEINAYRDDLESGRVDAETLENVAGLRHLAESIASLP
jgi:hypothetical protein